MNLLVSLKSLSHKDSEKTFVTLKGNNLNSFGDSLQEGTDGFKVSILRSIYRSQRDKRNLICGDYGNLLEECGGGKVRLGKVDKTKRVESVPSVPTPKVETVTTTETQVVTEGEQYIPNGRYKVTKVVDEKGYVLVWEKSLVLDISSVGNIWVRDWSTTKVLTVQNLLFTQCQ